MVPLITFKEDTSSYMTQKTHIYSLEKKLHMVNVLMNYIKDNPELIVHLRSPETTSTQKLIQIFLSGNLFSPDEMDINLRKYSQLPSAIKKNITNLKNKIKDNPIENLSPDEVQLLKDCLTLFISNKSVNNPQRNNKAKDLSSLKQEKLSIKDTIISIQFPRDWDDLEQALNDILIHQHAFQHVPIENIDTIHSLIHEALVSQFKDTIKNDCEALETKSGEIIIVSDDWETDDEIKAGLIIRDKAHIKFDGFAIVLTASELSRFLDLSDNPSLANIYKISTITHPNDFNFICDNINRLANLCCSSTDEPPQLREITLRQCFSAGRRHPKNPAQVARSAVNDATEPSQEEKQLIQQMLKHAVTFNPEIMKHLFELQTKSPQVLSILDTDASADRLIAILKDNQELQEKIPNLIVKGYFGPVKPFPMNAETHTFLPVDEKPPSGVTPSHHFYKAARYNVFTQNEQAEEDTQTQHIKRKSP